MSELERAIEKFNSQIERLSFAGTLLFLHSEFRGLMNSGMFDPRRPWLHTFEIAAIAKWVILRSRGGAASPESWTSTLNAHKEVWKATEARATYPEDPKFLATFVLRFVYQQLPWNLTAHKATGNWRRTQRLFGAASDASTALRRRFESVFQIGFDGFMQAAQISSNLFERNCKIKDNDLHESLLPSATTSNVSKTLNMLAATQRQFCRHHTTVASLSPEGLVYEFNHLLRYPLIKRGEHYWALCSETINYAATRGLFFQLSDLDKENFSLRFSEAFEQYVAELCGGAFGEAAVLTEKLERELGWHGKTNDVTVICGNAALLIECKNSGLFSLSKRSAEPADIASDVRKNLANGEKRKGLFQLYDKVRAIRNGELPEQLQLRYASVDGIYCVLLLYDEICFANTPMTLKNLIDDELRINGVDKFDYQIWHVEEFENLLQVARGQDALEVVHEKFSSRVAKEIDLSSFLCKKYAIKALELNLFVPGGPSRAWGILRGLADQL